MASGRVLSWAVAAGASCMALLAGCAAVPISGVAQPMLGSSGAPQQFVQPIPPPGPQVGELAQSVVIGFLHASASFAIDPGAARAYLAPTVKWQPAGTVTIVGSDPKPGQPSRLPPTVSGLSDVVQLKVVGQRIATINRSGQYSYQPDAATTFTFTLAKFHGRMLITQLPASTSLLLTQSDFEEVFQPHNLYFFAKRSFPAGALVPDPVYAPVQGPSSAPNRTVAGGLVSALFTDSGNWLDGATMTEFPAGTTLLRPVTVSNQTALVDLGGSADTATPGQLELMYEQLWTTLTSSAYSPAVATNVELSVDGKVHSNLTKPADPVPSADGTRTLYFASGTAVKQLPSLHSPPSLAPNLAQLAGGSAATALAATTVGADQVAVAVPGGTGCLVRTGTAGSASPGKEIPFPGGPCMSLSWDNDGSIWAVTKLGIFVLPVGGKEPVQVSPPTALHAGSRVLALRMAPDAVRAALLVQTGKKTQLYVSAARFGAKGVSFGPAVPVGTDLAVSGVDAVTWFNPYSLLAVSGSQVYQVPLTGGPLANGQSQLLGPGALPAGVRTITASGAELAVGTSVGTAYTSTAPYFSWTPIPGQASQPAFPG